MVEWYDIDVIYAGALDESRTSNTEYHATLLAEALAEKCRKAAATDGEDWQVYITPHWCNPHEDEECLCVQYLTDHHPVFSSEED